jgi:hypothetical protein
MRKISTSQGLNIETSTEGGVRSRGQTLPDKPAGLPNASPSRDRS